MKVDRAHIKKFIELVARETDADISGKGLGKMADELEKRGVKNISAKYLYELHNGVSKSPHESKLNAIAKGIGYDSFNSFIAKIKIGEDPILQSLAGGYYCYVRMHLEEGKVLRSPVRICASGDHMSYYLKGGRLEYTGNIKQANGCLFVLMSSLDGSKSFYHVYRIGTMPGPKVLQGIFSGVSTDTNPIGGRAVLLRKDEAFDSLTKKKIDLKTLQRSNVEVERRIAKYFKNKRENNITIKRPHTFGPEDL